VPLCEIFFSYLYYSGENFISDTDKFRTINSFTKVVVIPKNVKIAESRIPKCFKQQSDLIKEFK